MLQDFIFANRERIIERSRLRVVERVGAGASEGKPDHGIPLFLTQLVDALAREASTGGLRVLGKSSEVITIADSAALNGRDLLRHGFTFGQVVYGYGDVCQIVTELATETEETISPHEFQVFNRCLDDAIAGAVTAFGAQRERSVASQGSKRLEGVAHELSDLLSNAVLSFDAIRAGTVGVSGSTGAMHARSLVGLGEAVARLLSELESGSHEPARGIPGAAVPGAD